MPYVRTGHVVHWEDRPRVGCNRCVSTCWDGPVGPHHKTCGCPCTLDGCKHAAPWRDQQLISAAQRKLRARFGNFVVPRRRVHYLAIARWHELEAKRGYPSAESDRQAARNYRWLLELMENGQRVTADARGVYINGELASKVQERAQRDG